MAEEYARTDRVAHFLQREISDLIRREIKDPRVGMVTITEVKVSRDLAHAKLFVTLMGQTEGVDEVLTALNKAAGFLRHMLRPLMRTRKVPELKFVYDELPEQTERMTRLIDDAVRSDRSKAGNSGDDDGTASSTAPPEPNDDGDKV